MECVIPFPLYIALRWDGGLITGPDNPIGQFLYLPVLGEDAFEFSSQLRGRQHPHPHPHAYEYP